MKNETKKSLRLESILSVLRASPTNRLTLQAKLEQIGVQLTRPTLLRALAILLAKGEIVTEGRGRSTVYQIKDFNPLLAAPNPNFQTDQDIFFRPTVLNHFNALFTPSELAALQKEAKHISEIKKSFSSDLIHKEFERFCIELSWKSSAIEGNTYTLLETEALLKTNIPPHGHTSSETQMILNHKSAFELILNHPPQRGEISVSYITQLHQVLAKNLDITTGLRQKPVGIVGSRYLPLGNQWQIREHLDHMIKLINLSQDPYSQALTAIALLSYLQPFIDGNKRTARMLGNAILISHDLFPLSYRTVSEIAYKEALITFYEQNSLLPFKQIFLEQIKYAYSHYFLN